MSRGNGKKRLWRVAVLVAGVMTQLGLGGPGRAFAQAPQGGLPAVSTAAAPVDAKGQAKAKLSQARARLAQGDFDGAEALAKEAAALKATFGFKEDSPSKLQRELASARTDPKALLAAARAALARRELDLAEQHAKKADKCASMFTFSVFADSPAKALKDIEAARRTAKAAPVPAMKPKPAAIVTAQPAPAQPKPAAVPMPRTKAEASALLGEGRKALAQGKVDEAATCAQKARSVNASWGLFEDTPDALHRDIASQRGKRDKAEAARLLAEGRALHAKGDHDGAAKLAWRSQALYNGYGTWDMGDRPNKLLADCQAAKDRSRRTELPSGTLARRESPLPPVKPAVPTSRPGAGPNMAMAGVAPAPAGNPDKLRARQLLGEAQRLRAQGDLLAASKKAMEAKALKVAFATDETHPDLVCQQVAAEARRKVAMLSREANDALTYAKGDAAARGRAAKAKWQQARALAAGFMQDTRAIDEQLMRLAKPLPSGGVQQAAYQPALSHGQQLLAKARIELRNGQPGTARKMAEEAFDAKHGVQKEAAALLRTIDTEEFNQKQLQARSGFDAAEAALRRRDKAAAVSMLATVDSKLLDAPRQARLREINMIPGLASSGGMPAMKAVEAGTPSRSLPNDGLGKLQPVSAPAVHTASKVPGKAVATDRGAPVPAGGANLIDEFKQRQTALFQMMRQKGLEAQSQAAEKFRAGQHEAAIALLEDYVSDLDQQKLDGKQASLLRRPVEARRSQYAILKAQKDLAKGVNDSRNAAKDQVSARRRLEEQKRKNVQKLMRDYNTLFRERKFMEAEAVAMRAHEIDADNELVTFAISSAHNARNLAKYKAGAKERQDNFVEIMDDAENMGPVDIKRGVTFDKERSAENRKRKPWGPQTITRYSDKEKAIERSLLAPVSINFEGTPLKQVIDDLRSIHAQGVNIVPDMPALQERGISLEAPISIRLENVSLKSALNLILQQVGLTYVIKDEVLQITTEENAKGKQSIVTYQVADLVLNLDPAAQSAPPTGPPLPDGAAFNYAAPSPVTGPQSLTSGTPVGTATGGGFSPPVPGQSVPVATRKAQTLERDLIRTLTNSISPKSWSEMGGSGTIEFNPLTLALVINQTPDIQEQILELLTALRRLQDQTVSVEVRMITVSEDFFERIGVNFALNILTDKATRRFEPTLLNGTFVSDPNRFINNLPNLTGLISGVTPAGTLTPSLDIPITQQSFYQTFPTFGNYTGGGLNVGLAFLSDIQVFLFLEALQGNTRANVMQAPKITCANGQSSFVQVSESQNFLTSVTVTGLPGGQFAFVPTIQNFGTNSVSLSVTPLITDDRRFVRMSIQPNLQSLLPGPIPVIPVTVPIFTNLTNDLNVSQPVVFTQFVQTPRTASITVQTEVRIPDGGTVVMGGLKRLAEARTEFGPPVLSKLPYINRLFKNVGYGRETESLLIMVTARIIVLSEEEIRSTGFDSFGLRNRAVNGSESRIPNFKSQNPKPESQRRAPPRSTLGFGFWILGFEI